MRRGTRVGQAYVALSVDGHGVNDEITEAFDDVDYKKIGRDSGGRFSEGWTEKMRSDIVAHLKGIDNEFTQVLERSGKAIKADRSISTNMQAMVERAFTDGRLDKVVHEIGRRSGVDFGGEFGDTAKRIIKGELQSAVKDAVTKGGGFDLSALLRGQTGAQGGNFDVLGPLIEKTSRQVKREIAEWDKGIAKAQGENAALASRFAVARQKLAEQSANVESRFAAQRAKDDDRSLLVHQRLTMRLLKEEYTERARADKELWKVRNTAAAAHAKYLAQLGRGVIDEFGNPVSRNAKKGDSFNLADRVERMFGGGSRNNFLNFFGSSLGGMTRLFETFTRTVVTGAFKIAPALAEIGANAVKTGQAVASAFGENGAKAAFGTFTNSILFGETTVATAGLNIVAALGVVTAGIVAFIASAGLMAAVIGALAGIITAFTSTLASGLAGALAVAGGGMIALVAAGGLLVAAFRSMTDAQKALLKDAFQPLHAEITGIGQLIFTQFTTPIYNNNTALQVWSANLQKATYLLAPLAQVMGRAFAQSGNILTAALSGPGFQMLTQQLSVFLPSIITRLSRALGSFLNGLAATFAALLPYVNQFSGYLADVAARFSRFATSAQGQNSISDFVSRALTSLKSLWNAVREIGGFIADVLFNRQVQNAGNSIFDGIARSFASMRKSFAKAAADGSLQRWLDSAVRFGSALWAVIRSLYRIFVDLYNSGVLDKITSLVQGFADALDWSRRNVGPFIGAMTGVAHAIANVSNVAAAAMGPLAAFLRLSSQSSGVMIKNGGVTYGPRYTIGPADKEPQIPVPNMDKLISSGNVALNNTGVSSGGYKPKAPKQPKKYKNPYVAFANSLIKDGQSLGQQIRAMWADLAKSVREGMETAAKAANPADAQSAIKTAMEAIRKTGVDEVAAVQDALNAAARNLASASSKAEAKAALAKVRMLQGDLAGALRDQANLNLTADRFLGAQLVVDPARVASLMQGLYVWNASLADYASAREQVIARLEAAKTKLADAISTRDSYSTQVADSIKSFAALTTAAAQTLNGVEQSLTATDITSNLQTRLDKIRHFQSDLQLLLASGLSNDAYKQIVDAGVEQGSAFADALLAGGVGAIGQTNSLVDQINAAAGALGSETSSRMYQAGIDAAQGLVDGLTSLSAQLDAAAYSLGDSIAKQVAAALGIHSPSRVLRALMGPVGDGAVLGLGDQHAKVGAAAEAFAAKIAVSPEVASYASRQEGGSVSGNDGQVFRDLVIQTETKDPRAVAVEAVNELIGRLP